MAQTSSGSKGTPFLDEQRVTKRTKEHNHTTTNLQNQSQTSISMARKQVQDSNVDRISNLPGSIILHILSLLPTVDVVRTSLISKRWRHFWNSVPALEFSDVGVEEKQFYNFVNKCLEHRMIGKRRLNDLGIERFKLEMHGYGGSSVHVDRWLSLAVQQHLEELDLHIEPKIFCIPSFYYCIPSLTVLKLIRLRLDDEVFYNLIMGCPSLEKLFLHDCYGYCDLKVSSLSLKSFELMDSNFANSILVEAVNLQSFVFDSFGFDCNLDLVSCKNVRNLTLNHVDFYRFPSLEDLITELPVLESLTVECCRIHIIECQYLKVLVLTTIIDDYADEWDKEIEITVNTPNLVSFHCEVYDFTCKVLLNSPNLKEANIKVDYNGLCKEIDMEWYIDMIDFLSYFDCSKVVSLYVYSEENLMFPEKLRKFCRSPSNVKHLKVETKCKLKSESLLRDAMLWLSPDTQTLSIRSGENEAGS